MNLKKCWIFAALTLLMAITVLQAQQAPVSPALPAQSAPSAAPTPFASAAPSQPVSFYRLDLAIREMDGEKLVDTRRYSLWLQSGKFERMTAGSEVPYTSATYNPSGTQTKSYRSIGVSSPLPSMKGMVIPGWNYRRMSATSLLLIKESKRIRPHPCSEASLLTQKPRSLWASLLLWAVWKTRPASTGSRWRQQRQS